MRGLIIALASIVTSGGARAGCPTVTGVAPVSVSSYVNVTVLMDGSPVEGAVLEGFRQPKNYEAEFTLVTDARGTAATPKLSQGLYVISALTAEGKIGELLLSVKAASNTTSIPFDLDKGTWNQFKRTPEDTQSIAQFYGTVADAVGAAERGGVIAVYEVNSANKKPIAILHPDRNAHFSANLKDGSYLVTFYANDALPVVVLIRVSGEGDKKALAIKLGMRMC